jgi:Ca2+-binding RTX toxin-like protein
LTLPATVTAGNGNDVIQFGGGNTIVTLGNGNDSVSAGGGNNTVTLGNGNDATTLGNGSNVVVEGNGNDSVSAGNGNNLIVGGLGRYTTRVGNGANILIDGSATVNNPGDSFRQILSAWTANPVASNQAAIRSRFTVIYNSTHPNSLSAGSGIDWFFYKPPTTSNKKSTDFLN